jgi:hypothetical protein
MLQLGSRANLNGATASATVGKASRFWETGAKAWLEGIYRGKRSTPLRDIHVDPTYTVGKVLSIFLESVHFGFLGNLFGLLEHRRQNLTKVT